ncbi:MAG TPA: hypothetical protein VEG31_00490 [Thermoproteota archaeon]|nr:hypothetical protein [Thermoproteota archaeon]
MMPYPDLFAWWTATISWSIVFLSLVAVYLYIDSAKRRKQADQKGQGASGLIKDFAFVWVLLGLLLLYVISIDRGSSVMFALGNVLVEVLLLIYLLRNRRLAVE